MWCYDWADQLELINFWCWFVPDTDSRLLFIFSHDCRMGDQCCLFSTSLAIVFRDFRFVSISGRHPNFWIWISINPDSNPKSLWFRL